MLVLIVLAIVASVIAEFQEVAGINQAVESVKDASGSSSGIVALVMSPVLWAVGLLVVVALWLYGWFNR